MMLDTSDMLRGELIEVIIKYKKIIDNFKHSKEVLLKEAEYFDKLKQHHAHQDMFIKIIDECMGEVK